MQKRERDRDRDRDREREREMEKKKRERERERERELGSSFSIAESSISNCEFTILYAKFSSHEPLCL